MAQDKSGPSMEAIVNLAKRRGFVFPSHELYGGLGGMYDYGPLGAQLKRNVENLWWRIFVQEREDVFGIESTIIGPEALWRASGHLEHFTDPLVECQICHERLRADKPEELADHEHQGKFTEPRQFSGMFKTHVGVVDDTAAAAYLRPETAQGMLTNFENVAETQRARVPFGLAQIGRSFRNEITFRNFIFRMREFTIAELEYFVKPGTDEQYFDEWLNFMESTLVRCFQLPAENLKRYEHPQNTLAHYSKRTVDILYRFPWGWDELWGLSNRTDYDLSQHALASGKSMTYRDPASGKTFTPFIIEPTGGIDRLILALLVESYSIVAGGRTTTTESTKENEVVLKFPKQLAPIQAAVLPLSKKEALSNMAKPLTVELKKNYTVDYDEAGSIGRRYRRQDEIGTPYCLTVDFESINDQAVTIRDRDTMAQERVAISEVKKYLQEKLG